MALEIIKIKLRFHSIIFYRIICRILNSLANTTSKTTMVYLYVYCLHCIEL